MIPDPFLPYLSVTGHRSYTDPGQCNDELKNCDIETVATRDGIDPTIGYELRSLS